MDVDSLVPREALEHSRSAPDIQSHLPGLHPRKQHLKPVAAAVKSFRRFVLVIIPNQVLAFLTLAIVTHFWLAAAGPFLNPGRPPKNTSTPETKKKGDVESAIPAT